jgi:hypothetical protein
MKQMSAALLLTILLAAVSSGIAQEKLGMKFEINPLIQAPTDKSLWPQWRQFLTEWRQQTRKDMDYNDAQYRRSDFAWTPSIYTVAFVMLCDDAFYDNQKGSFTVDSFLEHGKKEFGGYDAVVYWHAYPRIGFDDRNQFDFYRDMPGGLDGVRKLSDQLHARGVKVFIDYNPWDTGTRRENKSDIDALVDIVTAINADGIFLDTMDKGAAEFRAKLDNTGRAVILESEGALPLKNLYDHHMSWAQWFEDSQAPGVLRNKWFERRHVLHLIRRWDLDHSSELQTAWMNGTGIMIWENVFGSWNEWNPRDRSILRSMLPIQRRYIGLFTGEEWTPLVETLQPDIYASLWESKGLRLWTLVNRSRKTVDGTLLAVNHLEDTDYFDLVHGCKIKPHIDKDKALIACSIPPRGIGAILSADPAVLGNDFSAFLKKQAKLQNRYDSSTQSPRPKAVAAQAQPSKKWQPNKLPAGMTVLDSWSGDINITFRNRECGTYEYATLENMRYPQLHQPLTFTRNVTLKKFAIDTEPVTNIQYAEFLKATGYRPKHLENFLKLWEDGRPPKGSENEPVVYVDMSDAAEYAKWAGKRLPAEDEWQYACQNGRLRWGEKRVWNWTQNLYNDGHTRFCILKGGSWYEAKGSEWYADGGPQQCSFSAKFLLMWPGLDRCDTIGFRCAADVE